MSFIFPNEHSDENQIDIDELYETTRKKDLKQIAIFNKLLNRIHNKIKIQSRAIGGNQYLWYNVPEYIFGEPLYDNGDCISYLVKKLETNGFEVKYIHPNNLYISWMKHIPSYVRDKFRKDTGKKINERGELIETYQNKKEEHDDEDAEHQLLYGGLSKDGEKSNKKEYTSTKEYKPLGKLVYDQELFNDLEKKVSFK
jgi:hypothetical protein